MTILPNGASAWAVCCGLAVAVVAGCVTTGPKFPTDVQQSYRSDEMRRMNTDHLEVYYPEHRREQAREVAARLEGCLEQLEHDVPEPVDWGPVPVFLPEVEFNNAYAAFGAGEGPHILVPTFFTANVFGQFGYTPSVSAVGCHEMVHYVHLTQIHGFYRAINQFFGPTINPQVGLDLWFFEGLATYYESQLVDGVGRYGSPIWENVFAAGIVDDHLDGGRLSMLDREVPFGAPYLVGSQFVAFLVDEYGERKLWELVEEQGSSLFFPFRVSGRFQDVYGQSLAGLISDFDDRVRDRYEPRERPDGQHRRRWVGRSAELEMHDSGRMALFSADIDEVAALEVYDEQGDRLVRRELPDVLPGRQAVATARVEALRFSEQGDAVFFLLNHAGRDRLRTSLMRLDVDSGRLETIRDDLRAVGADRLGDDGRFIIAAADGDRIRFVDLDTEGSDDETLFELPRGAYIGWIRVAPDAQRVAATLMEDETWSVAIFELDEGRLVGRFSTETPHFPAFDPYWLDDDRLMFAAADVDERVQIMEGNIADGEVLRRTDVPFMAFNPRSDGDGAIEFLNREGWGWSLDRADEPTDAPTDAVVLQTPGDDTGADPEVTGYTPAEHPVQVYEDEPYSMLDGLFTPRLRAPMVTTTGFGDHIEASLGLAGRDELGFHNWMVHGRWNFGDQQLSGSVGYVNTQLAPWVVVLQAANEWLATMEPVEDDPTELTTRQQRDRYVRLEAARLLYDTPVWLEATAADFIREHEDEDRSGRARRLVGAEAGANYRAMRATAYGGAQWMLGLSGQAGGYPSQLGSDFSMGHLRSQIDVHTPLPLSNRHRLRMSTRARALPGADDDEELMRVGGFQTFQPMVVSRDRQPPPAPDELLPRGFLFVEPLRGYEDLGITANQVVIGDVDYRFPIIVDRGSASALRVLPSVFLREFDLQAFASGATRLDGNFHAAVGASTDVAFAFGQLPMRLRFQLARRLVDDRQTVFTLSLGGGFGF